MLRGLLLRSRQRSALSSRAFSASTSPQDKVYKFGCSMGMSYEPEEKLLVPTLVPDFSTHKVRHVSCGWMHTLMATEDGLGFGWGSHDFGQLGIPNMRSKNSFSPEWMYTLDSVKLVKVAAGRTHSLMLTDSGQLFSAGGCEFGQLGDGVMEARARDMPQRIESLFGKKVVDIACGFDHSICLTASGEVYTWGFNREGQLGVGHDTDDVAVPTEVEGFKKKLVRVFAGLDYSMALTEDGDYYAWGLGEMWQFGNVERDVKLTPVLVSHKGLKFKDLALGGVSVLGLTDEGTVYSWGLGGNGRLGHGDETDEPVPKLIEVLSDKDIVQIAAKGGHHLALSSDGVVYSWGLGRSGRLGHDSENDLYSPTSIRFFKDKKVKKIACGLDHSVVVTDE